VTTCFALALSERFALETLSALEKLSGAREILSDARETLSRSTSIRPNKSIPRECFDITRAPPLDSQLLG
jgi:hypothetical protein